MNSWKVKILVAAVVISAGYAVATAQEPQSLLGSWDYKSMTNLKDGKPFGTIRFKPGQWTITFNADGHWTRNAPFPAAKPQSGKYKVHERHLTLNLDGMEHREKYEFAIQNDGKELTLTDKKAIFQTVRQP